MVEIYRGFSHGTKSPDLLVPDRGLVIPDRKKVRAEDLPGIFDVDVKLLTQKTLMSLGILPQGGKLELRSDPSIHTYKIKDKKGKDVIVESDGQYFLETVIGEHGVLAYYLPCNSKTSEHEHDSPISEEYFQIAGEAIANIGNKSIILRAGMLAISVPFNTKHQVLTRDEPAFMLVIMRQAGQIPRDQWHKPTNRHDRE